jgi:CBS domain-containing protein
MKARDVMTQPVVTVLTTTTLAQAAELLATHGFTALPVVEDDGRLVGIVTEADLIKDRMPPDPRRQYWRTRHSPSASAAVEHVMTTPVESLTPGADAADAVQIMLRQHIRCLPIVDGQQLVGIVTRRDLMRNAFALDNQAVPGR